MGTRVRRTAGEHFFQPRAANPSPWRSLYDVRWRSNLALAAVSHRLYRPYVGDEQQIHLFCATTGSVAVDDWAAWNGPAGSLVVAPRQS